MRKKLVAAVAVTSTLLIGGAGWAGQGGVAAADDPIPSWQYPSSIGSGYHIGNGRTFQAKVSTSGRWFVFESQATNLVAGAPAQGIYLRDRWTDTTVLVRPTVKDDATLDLTLSPDGNYIAGVDPRYPDPGFAQATWIYNHRTGTTSFLPAGADGRRQYVAAINNDGYIIASPFGGSFQTAARVLDDGSITTQNQTALSDRRFTDFTPSLQYGLVVNEPRQFGTTAKVDMVTGALTEVTGLETGTPGSSYSAAISPSGRYVAVLLRDAQTSRASWQRWDTTTGEILRIATTRNDATSVHAILDSGLILGVGRRQYVLVDVTHPADPPRVIADTDDATITRTTDLLSPNRAEVATDISRVVVCTRFALSPADTNLGYEDCYLRPFPPSPFAG